jgi:Fic family protein
MIYRQLCEERQMRLKGGLYHQTQIVFAYNTNRIEGSRLTEDQTRYIYETRTINTLPDETVNVDDIIETSNHFTCFDYMLDHASEDLSEDLIKEYHRLLKRGTSDEGKDWFRAGDYKTRPNMVGDTETTPPTEVAAAMRKLLDEYFKVRSVCFEDIVEFHYRFESIHPFQNGNGRVGRLIMFKECLANDVLPFIIRDDQKQFYYRGLKEYPREKGFLFDTCRTFQDQYEKLAAYFTPQEKK